MSKGVFLLLMLTVIPAQAQVFNNAQTLRRGIATVAVYPAIINYEGGNDYALFVHGGYGLQPGVDVAVKLGLGQDAGTYIGGDVEWLMRRQSPYFSLSAGFHFLDDPALDGTFNITFPLNATVFFYSGADMDLVMAAGNNTPMWLFTGLDVSFRRDIDVLFEVSWGVSSAAPDIISAGMKLNIR